MTALFRFHRCWLACTVLWLAGLWQPVLWLAVSSVLAEDWNQWRGPRRNGISSEPLALDKWPGDGLPTVAWRAAVGKGHSAISVSHGRAYTMGWNEQSDFVYCFEKWGAICVDPIVQDNGRIYCRSYEGEVVCLDLQPARARPAPDPDTHRVRTDASGQFRTDTELLEVQGNHVRLRELDGAMACNVRLLAEGEAMTKEPVLHMLKCDDFHVSGRGDAVAWERAPWVPLHQRPGGTHDYSTRFKMLYSEKGIYVLFDGADKTLTATMQEDFLDLWTEDVFECFFWTDEEHPVYFEYEISPLGYELPILIPNFDGKFLGWRPWHYEGDRKTRKAVTAIGGSREPHATVSGWRAEIFFPYDLFKPLGNVPPQAGTRWRANFYRVDYDEGHTTSWDWARVGPSFHDYRNFGTLVFE